MILENEILQVELDDNLPIILRTLHKPTGIWVDGHNSKQPFLPEINGKTIPPDQYESNSKGDGA